MKLIVDARYTRIGFHDGISRYTASLLTALKEIRDQGEHPFDDFHIAMAISDERQLEMLPELPHIKISSPTGPLEPTAALQLNRYTPDVVFSPMQTIGSAGRKFKLILTLHDLIYYSHPTPPGFLPAPVRLGWRIFHKSFTPQRFLLNRADAVVTVSETTKALMLAHSLTNKSITVVSNAPQPGSVISEQDVEARLAQRGPDLLYMGSFMPYKGVETLLTAMKELPEYRLHLLSKIQPARLEELTPLLADNVIVHNGTSDKEYSELLKTSAALLTASQDEGYGLPVVEAMAAGCPVVLSDIPIFREIAPSAQFATVNSPKDFAQKIKELENPVKQKHQALAGRTDALAYSWKNSAITLLDLIQKLG